MIGCDVCENWFHADCVDLDEDVADDIDMYVCIDCVEKTGRHTTFRPKSKILFPEVDCDHPSQASSMAEGGAYPVQPSNERRSEVLRVTCPESPTHIRIRLARQPISSPADHSIFISEGAEPPEKIYIKKKRSGNFERPYKFSVSRMMFGKNCAQSVAEYSKSSPAASPNSVSSRAKPSLISAGVSEREPGQIRPTPRFTYTLISSSGGRRTGRVRKRRELYGYNSGKVGQDDENDDDQPLYIRLLRYIKQDSSDDEMKDFADEETDRQSADGRSTESPDGDARTGENAPAGEDEGTGKKPPMEEHKATVSSSENRSARTKQQISTGFGKQTEKKDVDATSHRLTAGFCESLKKGESVEPVVMQVTRRRGRPPKAEIEKDTLGVDGVRKHASLPSSTAESGGKRTRSSSPSTLQITPRGRLPSTRSSASTPRTMANDCFTPISVRRSSRRSSPSPPTTGTIIVDGDEDGELKTSVEQYTTPRPRTRSKGGLPNSKLSDSGNSDTRKQKGNFSVGPFTRLNARSSSPRSNLDQSGRKRRRSSGLR